MELIPAEPENTKVKFYCNHICSDGMPCQKECSEIGKCEEHNKGSVAKIKKVTERSRMIRSAGRYYTRLPNHLKGAYLRIAKSQDMQSLAGEIALVELRIGQVFEKLNTNETESKWVRLRSIFYEFRNASKTQDKETMVSCLDEMEQVITQGNNEADIWRHLIDDLFVKKAMLTQVESKRMHLLGATATAEQVRSLAAALITCFLEEVSDYDTRSRVIQRIKELKVFDWDIAPPVETEEDSEE